MTSCPCGSSRAFDDCCGPLLRGEHPAATAEALLRSRYTAFTRQDIDYIERTTHSDGLEDFDRGAAQRWSAGSEWLGLEVLSVKDGGPDDDEGEIEFVARFVQDGKETSHHEIATFARDGGEWRFLDGEHPGVKTFVRETPKIGRNDPCPCGSGKKYKKCCGS